MTKLVLEKKDIDGEVHNIYRIIFNENTFALALKQAYLKSKHTNTSNQAGIIRTPREKFNKQLEGVLGEMAVKQFLFNVSAPFLPDSQIDILIKRYDDIRIDDFKSSRGEYDLKIDLPNNPILIEARASLSYKYDIENAIKNLDTIGPYVNKVKRFEKKNDLYIRPLFQLKTPDKNLSLKEINILDYFLDNKLDLFITGGAPHSMMIDDKNLKDMGQKGTKYYTLNILKGMDVLALEKHIEKIMFNFLKKNPDSYNQIKNKL